jgi:transposase
VVELRVRVRRFRCTNPLCRRRIFAERLPQLAAAYARRTHGQRAALTDLGLALGGSAGAQLGKRRKLAGSRATILRLVHATPTPPCPAPRVLGVDDWAKKRGHSYGTILVDLERRRPVDLLDGRSAAGLASWLAAHPGVEIIARDRGGTYAEGARLGAPAAIQVADRFHLLANIGDAFEHLLLRQASALRSAAKAVAQSATGMASEPASGATSSPPRPPTRTQREAQARRDRRQARYDEIRALAGEGHGARAIARHLHLDPKTVRKYLRAESCPHPGRRPNRRSLVDPWLPHLQERWAAGCRNADELFREIKALGFAGGRSIVSARLAQWRAEPRRPGPYPTAEPAPAGHLPRRLPEVPDYSPRRTRWLLLKEETSLTAEQQAYCDELLAQSAAIEAACTLTRAFWRLIRERDGSALGPWLTEARASGLAEFREFAAGIERDRAAVDAALIYEWSSGQTEGQITRLKLLKRQMFGRASIHLLRRRFLQAA